MKNLIQALSRSLLGLFHPKILLLMFVPPILALVFWGAVAFFTWPHLMAISAWMISWAPDFVHSATGAIAVILAIGMVLPLAIVSVLVFTSVLAMPVIVPHVANKYFPELEKNNSGAFSASLKNALWTSAKYLVLWFLTMPLWFVPGLNIAVPLILNGYLNYKLFIYDALGNHASAIEIQEVIQAKRAEFYVLGLLTAVLVIVPVVFLIAPFYSGLAFTHMGLSELKDFRNEKPKIKL